VREVETEIQRIETELAEEYRRHEEATSLLPSLEAESDSLVQRLGGSGEATMARVGELAQEEQRLRDDARQAADDLVDRLAGDVALALAGPTLRDEVVARLRAEEMREAWEAGRKQGNANLDRYVDDFGRRLEPVRPPLDEKQREVVVGAVRDAWHALWHPAPEGCAEEYLHGGLMGATRAQAIERIGEVAGRSVAELNGLVATFRSSVDAADARKRERLALEQHAPEVERLGARLREVGEEKGRLQQQRDDAQRAKEALEGDLAAKRQELGRYTDAIGRGKPALRLAKQAEAVSRLIDEILAEAVPTQVGAVAEAMTRAWKSMAHMADRVDRIEITPECEVRMLNRRGENLHEIEKSAGASQVFTQALIWAVTNVSGRDFPFIVDTPLARLSHEQRLGVLRTFTDRLGQVILLSTDEEVVGDKLDAIRDRILAAYQLRVRHEDGVSVTTIEEDPL
jgi:DNA sulfur modification protein DndD